MASVAEGDTARLRRMISGYMVSQVIHVTAALGLADLTATTAMGVDTLARQTGTHGPSLTRLLRALIALGLAEQPEPGRFRMTELGAPLRTDIAGSLRDTALVHGGEAGWRAWGSLLHAVRTGENAFEHVFGMGSFQQLARSPERAAIFTSYMAEATRRFVAAILAGHDFTRYRRIVDVGGGNGVLLSRVLAALPDVEGIIFDTPSGVESAQTELDAAGVAARCRLVAGDFFRDVPESADAYILKSVLHDWDDERAVAILDACRRAMRRDSTLLVVERLLPERIECSNAHREIAMMDLHMLAVPGGRERTASEYAALLAAAELRSTDLRPTASPFAVITAVRADTRTVQQNDEKKGARS